MVQGITPASGAWTPRSLLLTATATVATGSEHVRVVEHIPLALLQGNPKLGYVSNELGSPTTNLVTRLKPNDAGSTHIPAQRPERVFIHTPTHTTTVSRGGGRRGNPSPTPIDPPTWVSPQRFTGALDHVFVPSPAEAAHTTVVRFASRFTSDHLAVTSAIDCLPPSPQLVCPARRGRYAIPRKTLPSHTQALNQTFQERMLQHPPDSDASTRFQRVTSALTEVTTVAYGPPQASHRTPAVVWGPVPHLHE